MKLKKVRIVIQPFEDVKAEWKRALRAEQKSVQNKGVIFFPSVKTLGKVITPVRLVLLEAIIKRHPKSIYALAKLVGRDFKNVHTDVKVLAEVGFIELKSSGSRDAVTPVAKYSGFELDLAA
ncbi:MAG: hypothetical protein HY537_12765 [Deltaproteobacteria bacterium]|nr:hypothetical protein [Deltaproteobacteria bacterium]